MRLLRKILVVCLVVGIFFFIGTTILSRLGGTSAPLKDGLENFFSGTTGTRAQIGTLHGLYFYPVIRIDIEDLVFFAPEDAPDSAPGPLARIGRLRLDLRFVDVLLGNGFVSAFTLSDAQVRAGVLAPQAILIDQAVLRESVPQGGHLAITGHYGTTPVDFALHLAASRTDHGVFLYHLREKEHFTLTLGDIHAQGNILPSDTSRNGFAIDPLTIGLAPTPDPVFSGTLTLSQTESQNTLTGHLTSDSLGIDPHLIFEDQETHTRISGTITLKDILPSHLLGESPARAILGKLLSFTVPEAKDQESPPISLPAWDADIVVAIEDMLWDGETHAQITCPVRLENHVLTLGPLSGETGQGFLTGDALLTAAHTPAEWQARLTLTNLRHGNFLGGLDMALSGSARNFAEIPASITGTLRFALGGRGAFPAILTPLPLWEDIPHTEDTSDPLCLTGDFVFSDGDRTGDMTVSHVQWHLPPEGHPWLSGDSPCTRRQDGLSTP